MKKTLVFALAAVLVVAFVAPSFAFENVFGGYWRTRWFWQEDFTGVKDAPGTKRYDTRTRLYYTAKFSDDFSFVNKFEFNTQWGDGNGGDIGADGSTFRIKNSYADFRTGQFRHTVGIQGAVLARGFLFDDDFSGYIARYQPGTTGDLLIPFLWARAVSGETGAQSFSTPYGSATVGGSKNEDVNHFAIFPFFPIGDNMVLNPYFLLQHFNTDNVAIGAPGSVGPPLDIQPWWLGVDFDMKSDAFGLWASGIYNGGEVTSGTDFKAFLLAAGVDFNLGMAGLWVDGIYATGQSATATDAEAFLPPAGASYYWAEIMGLGIFDNTSPLNTPGNQISNIMTLGVGADWKLGDKFKLSTDLWWAKTAEKVTGAQGQSSDDLGFEIDVILTWALVENLNVDLVAAYLAAGDAIGTEDPMEIGARMSFSF
jgi:hypothetical protein